MVLSQEVFEMRFTSRRLLLLVGLQFAGIELKKLCPKIKATFDGLVLGAGTSQFPHREIVRNPTVWDDIKEILNRNGLCAPKVAAHPLIMGAVARGIHPGYEEFLGENIYREKSDGTPDEDEIHRLTEVEWEEYLCPALKIAGITELQTFFGSATHVDRSREFPRPSEAYLDDLEGREVEVVRHYCDVAQESGIEVVAVESHIGESHLCWYSQKNYMARVNHPIYKILHDGSHGRKLGGDPADGIDQLTEHCPGVIGDVHLKGGGVKCSNGRIISSWYPCGDHRRGSQYQAVHRLTDSMIEEVIALNRHEEAGGVELTAFALEHEDDHLKKLSLEDAHPALNAMIISGEVCRERLLFRGDVSHQTAMKEGR